MEKIPTLYRRDYTTRPPTLTRDVTPGCEWVLAGEGLPTRKWDGVCMRLDDQDRWWARREVKPGRPVPPDFLPVTTDPTTKKTIGWEPAVRSPFAKYLRQALDYPVPLSAGETFELIGPSINGNPDRLSRHLLAPHHEAPVLPVPGDMLDYDGIRTLVLTFRETKGCEGIVWHHPDGRMCKIKARDFADLTVAVTE